MKHLSKKPILSILIALVVFLLTMAIVLSLSMCQYDEPVDFPKTEEDRSPYGMYDYSKRAFFTNSPIGCCIYKGDAYFTTQLVQLVRVPLNQLSCDLRTSKVKDVAKYYSICQDSTHAHSAESIDHECIDWLCDVSAQFLIDAYESAGDFPIIYYYRSMNHDPTVEAWDQSATYEVYRYDTGKAMRECIASMTDPLIQMMTYDGYVFFVTQSSQNEYQLNSVSKKGGTVTTVTVGAGKLTMLGVYKDRVVFRDGDGSVYQIGFDFKNSKKIYQVPEVIVSGASQDFQGVFVHGKYLYFPADYEAIPYPLSDDGTQIINLMKHSIRRVPLDAPQGEGELVVENVWDDNMYGIVDNVFYYSPCIAAETTPGYYYNFTGGLLKGVNLETLETVEMKEDTGIIFNSSDATMSGSALISVAFPVRAGYNIKANEGYYRCLYDLTTGALYPLYVTG